MGSGSKFPEGSERLVPEGLGRFRRVPESSGACWCRFQRQGSEGSGGFRRVPARVGVASGGRVQKVSGEFRCGLLPCNLDRSSHVIVLITGITLSTWAKPLLKKAPM